MERTRPAPGTTLVELTIVLIVLGVLCTVALPALGRGLDVWAVRNARNALAAGVARARSLAIVHGGARLVIAPRAATFWVESDAGERVAGPVDLAAGYGVALEAGGSGRLSIRFDAFGIGRFANRTISLTRGDAEQGLTLSTYGRVRRW